MEWSAEKGGRLKLEIKVKEGKKVKSLKVFKLTSKFRYACLKPI